MTIQRAMVTTLLDDNFVPLSVGKRTVTGTEDICMVLVVHIDQGNKRAQVEGALIVGVGWRC